MPGVVETIRKAVAGDEAAQFQLIRASNDIEAASTLAISGDILATEGADGAVSALVIAGIGAGAIVVATLAEREARKKSSQE